MQDANIVVTRCHGPGLPWHSVTLHTKYYFLFLYSYNLIFIETKMNFQNAHAISSEILACIEPGIFDTRLDSWNH